MTPKREQFLRNQKARKKRGLSINDNSSSSKDSDKASKFVEKMIQKPGKTKLYKGGKFKDAIDLVEQDAQNTAKEQFQEYDPKELKTPEADTKTGEFNQALKLRGATTTGDAVSKYKNSKGRLKKSKSFNMPTFKRTKNETKLLDRGNRKLKRNSTISTLGSKLGIGGTSTPSSYASKGASILKGMSK